jgi:hypothetical protein
VRIHVTIPSETRVNYDFKKHRDAACIREALLNHAWRRDENSGKSTPLASK